MCPNCNVSLTPHCPNCNWKRCAKCLGYGTDSKFCEFVRGAGFTFNALDDLPVVAVSTLPVARQRLGGYSD